MAEFIDYVTLLLANMTSALVVLAFFLWWGLDRADQGKWAPAFGISGLVATIAGLAMCFTWPIPKPFASAYGEMSVLFGVLFLGAAWALARGWSLTPLGIYAFVPGAAAILIGIRMIDLSLTPKPLLTGLGFIVTGSGGIFAGLALGARRVTSLRIIGGLTMFGAALLWAPTTYMGYWAHMEVQPQQRSTSTSTGSKAAPPLARPGTAESPSPNT